jgi:hypothetical protein
VHIFLERGEEAERLGRFRVELNGEEVFEKEFGTAGERAPIFGRGSKSNQDLSVVLWVQGDEGAAIPDINVSKVVLTKAKK